MQKGRPNRTPLCVVPKVCCCNPRGSLQRQGHEPFVIAATDHQQQGGAPRLAGLFDPVGQIAGGLDLLPAHFSFRNLDLALRDEKQGKKRMILGELLHPLAKEYDYVILDCPPNLTFLSETIVTAADCVVTPVIPTTLSLLALEQLIKLLKKIDCDRRKVSSFFSMAERRKTMHQQVMEKYGGYPIFLKTVIPFMAEIEKMGLYRQPVGAGGQQSPAHRAYQMLWQEIKQKKLET